MSRPQLKRCGLLKMVMAVAMVAFTPLTMKALTVNMDFQQAAIAATSTLQNYEANILMSSNTYSTGASNTVLDYNSTLNVGDKITYKYGNSTINEIDISSIAFNVNNGNANGFNFLYQNIGGNRVAGLYSEKWNSQLAVLNLAPGDVVKITYSASTNVDQNNGKGNGNLRIVNKNNARYFNQVDKGETATEIINIDASFGDALILTANKGTIINSIEIELKEASYEISTSADGKTTTFAFNGSGRIFENDFAVPYMTVSFGSTNDRLLVDNSGGTYQCRMLKSDGTEKMETDETNYHLPKAGNFYEFRPTGGGEVTITGGFKNGGNVHLFVFNPDPNVKGWVDCQPDQFYAETIESPASHYGSYSFTVKKNFIYYVCINKDDPNEADNAFHLHSFSFRNDFQLEELAKVIDLNDVTTERIHLTQITGYNGYEAGAVKVKRCSGNINESSLEGAIDQYGNLSIKKPTLWDDTKDNAGTVVLDIDTYGGKATFVVTFAYHASYGYDESTGRSAGHTWNFMDPRLSDSNIGNSRSKRDGVYNNWDTTTGILSIGQYKNQGSQLRHETDDREWTYSQRQTGSAGGFHDPYYANVYDMEGDNADMIWETEGLWFDTGTNLSCIYNEKNALAWNDDPWEQKGNPVNFKTLQLVDDSGNPKTTTKDGKEIEVNEDPDRYVGLLPDPDGKSSFTIPCLKDGDRVLIFMKSGEATGTNGIFLNVHGALDAEGTPINENDLYKAGGTNWIHSRYEGCYHFIKNGDGDMKFDMVGGSMCKLLYIRIYKGKRIDTNDIVSTKYIPIPGEFDANGKQKYTTDSGHLLFINDKDATEGDYSTLSEHYSGKGQNADYKVLTYSGNLNTASFEGDNFKISGAYHNLLDFKSKVGEMGVFRLRVKDLTYTNDANQNKNYVADLCDRNFTVGYRDKVDYPYTWDFTDVNVFSNSGNNKKIENEATKYKETTKKYENTGWDISLFDKNGNMKVNSGVDPSAENQIFSADKAGFGNQLWADDGVIAEMRGLWFYTDDNDPRYNDCLQITNDGLRLANTPDSDDDPANNTQRKAWWNYKMVVPSVPAGAAVYLRMKRDYDAVDADAKSHSNIDNADVYFLASRFNFGVASAAVKTNLDITADRKNEADYSCFKVPGTEDECIVAIKNTTGKEDHLTFTLNGWILEKVAVSLDPKTLNVKGYASESRKRIIDHSLTEFFTGVPVKAYMVKDNNPDAKPKKVLELVEVEKPMPAANGNGDNCGVVLHNTNAVYAENNGQVKILNDEFHLFVPDMHDTDVQIITNNIMLSYNAGATANAKLPAKDGNYTNYALNYRYYKLDKDGNVIDGTLKDYGEEAFFRVANGGANIKPNSAYIHFPTDQAGAKVSIAFFDDIDEGTTTEIVDLDTVASDADTDVYYTLSGVRISRPTSSGLYIKNGKKVYVK